MSEVPRLTLTSRILTNERAETVRALRWRPLSLPGVHHHLLWLRVVSPRSLPLGALLEVRIAAESDPTHTVVLRYGLPADPRFGKNPSRADRLLPSFLEPLLRHELEFFTTTRLPEVMDDILVVSRTGRVTGVLAFSPPNGRTYRVSAHGDRGHGMR